MMTFVTLARLDLVKASFQYAVEEAEHRLVANHAAGARPANNIAFAPKMYNTVAEYLANLRQLGIIGGTGMIDGTNVIERMPGGVSVSGTAVLPSAPPRTGGGFAANGNSPFAPRRLGDG